jgi:hypothetical protein
MKNLDTPPKLNAQPPTAPLGSALTGAPQRPLNPDNLGNDALILRQLVNQLNDPRLDPRTDPSKPIVPLISAEAKAEIDEVLSGAAPREIVPAPPMNFPVPNTSLAAPLAQAESVKPPAPVPPPAETLDPTRILLTGRHGTDAPKLAFATGAKVFGLAESVFAFAQVWADSVDIHGFPAVAERLHAWGDGSITDKNPMSLERVWITHTARQIDAGFGRPGFWAKRLLAEIEEYRAGMPRPVIVIGISELADFTLFRNDAKFTHFHVMVSNATLAKRLPSGQPSQDLVSTALDNDVIRQISQNKAGSKLRCVWNDETPPPTNRFWSAAEFAALIPTESRESLPHVQL